MCTCASQNRRWLGTGDRGPDNAIIIWDAQNCLSVRTIINSHQSGVISIQLTPDARYLATLSADSVNQVFAMWDWTTPGSDPMCYTQLSADLSTQTKINFKEDDYFHCMTNSESHVVFYDWVSYLSIFREAWLILLLPLRLSRVACHRTRRTWMTKLSDRIMGNS